LQGLQPTSDNTKITDHCLRRKKFGVKNEFYGKCENLRFLRVLGQTVANSGQWSAPLEKMQKYNKTKFKLCQIFFSTFCQVFFNFQILNCRTFFLLIILLEIW